MLDLISTSEELHYENYRQAQMETRKFGEPKIKKSDNPKFKEEEEQLRKKFTEQVKAEEARFRQWEQHVRYHRQMWTWCAHIISLVDRGARPSEQGSGNGSQCDQAARGGVGEPPGWLRTWHRQTMNACFVRIILQAAKSRLAFVSSHFLVTVAWRLGVKRSLSPFRAHYPIVYPPLTLTCLVMENFAAFLGYAQALPRMTYFTVVLVSQFFCLSYMFTTTTSSFHSLIAAFYFLSLPMDICGFFREFNKGYSGYISL